MMHACQCEMEPDGKAGWCPRHEMRKPRHWVDLCRSSESYRRAWDMGRGPGQNLPKGKAIVLTEPRPGVQHGPGVHLRRMLGCSAKKWPHYQKMERLGTACESHVKELAESLVADGYVHTQDVAERIIRSAIKRGTHS